MFLYFAVLQTHPHLDDDFDGKKNGENKIRSVNNVCVLGKHNDNQSLRRDKG